jgi:hypothetical protein
MMPFLWPWLILPLIHWLIVSLAFAFIGKLLGAEQPHGRGASIAAPMDAVAAEMVVQVRRADGTMEPPKTYRVRAGIFRRCAKAIKAVFR